MGGIFLGTAVPLFLIGNVLAYLSLGRSMHYLLGLTPTGWGTTSRLTCTCRSL